MKYDFIIIGGGLGGLCTGIILAKENKKVLILEQHTKPGGYLHSFYRKKFKFESGFHFVPELGSNQILSMYWDYLGIMDKIKIIPYNKKHFHTLIFPDLKIELPSGFQNLKETLISIFPAETKKITIFLDKMLEIRNYFIYFNRTHKGDLEKEHESFNISINNYLDSIGASQKLKSVLLAHSFLYGVPPVDTPLGTHSIFFNALYSSISDIEGGGDALSNALVESFCENGGEILFKKNVKKIKTDNKIIKGVETSDDCFYESNSIISSVNPKSTLNMFIEQVFRPVYTGRIDEMKNSTSHFGGYFIGNENLSNYYYDMLYFPDHDINSIYQKPVSGEFNDFFLYITVPTSRTNKPDNKSVIETLSIDEWKNYSKWTNTTTGKRSQDYYDFKQKTLDKVKLKLYDLIPEIKNNIEYEEGSTPLTNYNYTLSCDGSIYGLMHNMDQMRSPLRARTKLDGFYFTGQSLIFPGIVGVTITGFVTCSDILGQDYLFNKIDKKR